ncbi:MAG: lamin tail domain-containing protein [Cyclobacteriaceae bacterium]
MKRTGLLMLSYLSFLVVYSQDLRIYHIDVNQADATLFVTSTGESMLVDSGGNGAGDEIFEVMQEAGISDLDIYITTHFHSDHYGGVDELVQNHDVEITQAYDRGDKETLSASKTSGSRYMEYDQAIGSRADMIRAGRRFTLGEMAVECLASGGVVANETESIGHDENDLSVAILVNFRGFKYFVGGDIHEPVENKIAENGLAENIDMYQANHHGSHTSSAVPFLNHLTPAVIIISNGNHNGFGHPRQSTLSNMQDVSPVPDIFQTNKFTKSNSLAGNVTDQFIADLDPGGDEGTILVSLTGSRYTVTFGNFSKAYDVKAAAAPSSGVVIESVLPNPVGSDAQLEEVVIRNDGSTAMSINDWVLQDASGKTWRLSETINPGQSTTIVRNGRSMSLNNDGDMVELLNSENVLVDEFRYVSSSEGQRINTGH